MALTLTLAQGQTGTVAVTADITSGVGQIITWSLMGVPYVAPGFYSPPNSNGLPQSAKFWFAPPITPAGATTTLTILANNAPVGTYQLFILATSVSPLATVQTPLTLVITQSAFVVDVAIAETVLGTVTDQYGYFLAGVQVQVTAPGGYNQLLTTNALGQFTAIDVPTPYIATIGSIGSGFPTAVVQYQGLTVPNPFLTFFNFSARKLSSVLSGTFTGSGTYPETTGYSTAVAFLDGLIFGTMAEPTSGAFTHDVVWNGPTTLSGTIVAIQTFVSGTPVSYSYGSKTGVVLKNGLPTSGQTVSLASASTATFAGTIVPPGGFSTVYSSMQVVQSPYFSSDVFDDFSGSDSFNWLAPIIPGTSMEFYTVAVGSTGTSVTTMVGLPASSPTLTITMAPPSVITSPAPGATGVTAGVTPFTCTPFVSTATALYEWVFTSSGNPSYFVVSESPTVTIPDASALGIALPSVAAYGCYVVALDSPGIDAFCVFGYSQQNVSQNLVISPTVTVQTAP